MGCVSSSFLEHDSDNLSPTFSHHIVSLTSSTYGLLSTLDPSTPPPPPRPIPLSPTPTPKPEIINSWELMAGLDSLTPPKPPNPKPSTHSKETAHRSLHFPNPSKKSNIDSFEKLCPPGGENAIVLYTTTLGGIRKTFDDCNAVRAALESLGVGVQERDVSMDQGFREELRGLTGGSGGLPRVFVRGRCVGGAEEVMRIYEEGGFGVLVEGLEKVRGFGACDGCGGVRFLPCFRCNGSRKLVVGEGGGKGGWRKGRAVRCPDCNENGLMFCPICS